MGDVLQDEDSSHGPVVKRLSASEAPNRVGSGSASQAAAIGRGGAGSAWRDTTESAGARPLLSGLAGVGRGGLCHAPPMLETLDHVIVAVRDLEAATGRMARLLGRTPSWRGEHPGEGTANTLFRLDNTYLELLAPLGDGAAGRALQAWLSRRGEGIAGVAFGTPDAEACHRQFGEAQLEPGPVSPGMGRDVESGAYREWQRFDIPPQRTRGVFLFAIEHQSPADILPPAGQLAEEAATVSGLDHVVVRTADPEAAIRLYGEGLGLRLALDRSFPKWGRACSFFGWGA